MDSRSDEQLLRAFGGGEQQAFSLLMRRHSMVVKAYSLRMLRNAEQAEEVCSETFLRLAVHKGRWDERGSFRSWLFTIAHNLCIDRIRRRDVARRAARGVLELTLHQQVKPSPEAQAILGERATMLERAIAELKEEHRQVILLRSIHGLSSREAAKVLDISPAQVDSQLSYARKKLKQHLSQLNEKPSRLRSKI